MNVIKEKWNMICIALYAVTIVCLLLPAYSAFGFGVSAFTVLFEASFGAIVLFLVPVGGLVFSIVTKEKKNYLIHMILFILGLILDSGMSGDHTILISKSILAGEYGALLNFGFGSILTILCDVAGAVMAFLCMGSK